MYPKSRRFRPSNKLSPVPMPMGRTGIVEYLCDSVQPACNLGARQTAGTESRGACLGSLTSLKKVHIRGIHRLMPRRGRSRQTLEIFQHSGRRRRTLPQIDQPGFGHVAFAVTVTPPWALFRQQGLEHLLILFLGSVAHYFEGDHAFLADQKSRGNGPNFSIF
jgi:hypothetical protein